MIILEKTIIFESVSIMVMGKKNWKKLSPH